MENHKPESLFAELKRRRVFRVAAVYAVAAWAVIQVADTTFPHLGLPEWLVPAVIALVALGFPLALVLAWGYDVTPEGVVRTGAPATAVLEPPAAPAAPRTVPAPPAIYAAEPPARSVAVLPFVNMSSDPEQEFFSDGMTEELLHALAQVPELQVAPRTSSFAFKGQNTDVREIGRKLGVASVLKAASAKAATASGSRRS